MILNVLGAVLVLAGVAFLVVSAVGILRLPDFFTRAHAVAKSETLGILLVLVGLVFLHRFGPGTTQMLFIAVFSLIANATATHAIAHAAVDSGLEPWTKDER
jgi:multicomponent Na+:H+ antiporter subunit G